MPSPRRRRGLAHPPLPQQLAAVNLNAAAIDIGATEHWVAVPPDRDPKPQRPFTAFTAGLEQIADWLEACNVDSVVMESTGNYWIPLFELLDERGFNVKLIDPRRLKQVPGRKSDIRDCAWHQQLETFGLLSPAFRPDHEVVFLRSYVRQRAKLVRLAASHIQGMQNALTLMNIKLQHVVSDITGVTGMAIIRAILAGERDPKKLAEFRDYRCKESFATIAAALLGHWRDDHLFELRQSVSLFDQCQLHIAECDAAIHQTLAAFDPQADPADLPPRKRGRKSRPTELRSELFRAAGADLTSIEGIEEDTAVTLLAEIGHDMSHWPTVKHFTSWLGLCPAHDISGGKILRRGTKPCASRAALALRLAANSLHHSHSALGAFLRRKKAHLGAPKAVTATAHKLARHVYFLLKYGTPYADIGEEAYERQFRNHQLKVCERMAHRLGMTLQPAQPVAPGAP
jgi:transposase